MKPRIIHCDNHVLVVQKPHGMPTQEDESRDDDLLSSAKQLVKQRYNKPGNVFLGLLHRLDRPAGGLLVMARTSKAAARLSDQFRRRIPLKRYFAVIEGIVDESSGLCEDYLRKDSIKRKTFRVPSESAGAKFARLQWRRLAVSGGMSLLEVALDTGRPHQIRAQLAARGMPLLGDVKYGAGQQFLGGRAVALYSFAVGVRHPVGGAPLLITLGPGDEWDSLFAAETRAHVADFRPEDFLKADADAEGR